MIYPCSLSKDFGRAARHVRPSPTICCDRERWLAGPAADHPNVNLQGAVLTGARDLKGWELQLAAPTIAGVEPMPVDIFEELVAEALDSLPPELGDLMENVAVLVADRGEPRNLLGLYEGVPLTDREGYGSGATLPDRILLFRLAICDICRDKDQLRREIGVTVVHEVAHHFGIDDDRLRELGWG